MQLVGYGSLFLMAGGPEISQIDSTVDWCPVVLPDKPKDGANLPTPGTSLP